MVELKDTLQSTSCYVVVDRSFFLENPEVILAYLIFAVDHKILGRGGFAVYVSKDLQLKFVVELCSSLGILEVL